MKMEPEGSPIKKKKKKKSLGEEVSELPAEVKAEPEVSPEKKKKKKKSKEAAE